MLGLCTVKQWPGRTNSLGAVGRTFKILIKPEINNNLWMP